MPLHRLTSDGHIVPADQPRHRDPGRAWRSTYAWQRARAEQIARQPYCSVCGARTRLSADHIAPAAQGGALLDRANLQTLCLSCNAS